MTYLRLTSGIWFPEPAYNLPGMIPGVGFSAGALARSKGSQITGTEIGTGSTLTNISDGLDDVNNTQCSGGNIADNAYGYYGFSPASAKRVFSADVFGPNNYAYFEAATGTLVWTLRGKTGSAPTTPQTDGTSLGSVSFTSTTNEGSAGNGPRSIESSDKETLWDHIWGVIQNTTGALRTLRCAELDIYEAV